MSVDAFELFVSGRALVLRTGAEVHFDADNAPLYTAAAAEVRGGERALDLGCGHGALGVAAGAAGAGSVLFADVHAPSVALALENAARNGLTAVSGAVGDLLGAVGGRTFDLVLFNPPQTGGPQALAARHPGRYGGEDGAAHFMRFIAGAREVLPELGARAVLMRLSRANPGAVDAALRAAGFALAVRQVQPRTFTLAELDALAPGTGAQQLALRAAGRAEFEGPGPDGRCTMRQELVVATRVA